MWSRICVIILSVTFLASCTSSDDSSSSTRLTKTWTVEKGPLIGSIGSIAVGENGSVFAVDTENYTVLKYDSTGTFVTQTGRQGSGPGEFADEISDIEVFDKTVYVIDKTNRRLNLFTTDLEYVRQVPFPRKAPNIKQMAFDDSGQLYGGRTGTGSDDWLLHGVLQADSSRFIDLKHVHGDRMYDQFKITTSPTNSFLAVSYAFKDTIEVHSLSNKPVNDFPIIRDHSHERPPPVAKGVAPLKSRPLPDEDDFITWDMSSDERGYIWLLAGNYAKPSRQVLYVYNTKGSRIFKAISPSRIYDFTIRGKSLFATIKNSTDIAKYKIDYP